MDNFRETIYSILHWKPEWRGDKLEGVCQGGADEGRPLMLRLLCPSDERTTARQEHEAQMDWIGADITSWKGFFNGMERILENLSPSSIDKLVEKYELVLKKQKQYHSNN